ncbi:protein containing DNA/RNA helicase C-terminal domain [Sulfurimonas gotlandica GD1]|jgi:ATP-dependent RNA helicase RhlE|uniref:Protein containing DNA/RNA helicase C-terminal domain n=1 Tax=Sulfurimonas gotlandica (strain DSM 19862 / JCM 16533 / GD1) TaxID=929558 RepID=B6BJV9_SULGG|nr:DEAD/DEAH box helicase [Sulfurimonas gotlandica]EDZ62554.1 Helicase conserved C-terminal domain protein [Sulfurimonas gotlandica GD1]EHP31360.1 protein containing DNA/RNA helicase C-terminal domain [Sulfurimonas gotlandica GD1]
MDVKIKKPRKRYFDNVSVGKRTKQVVYSCEQHDKAAMFEQFIKNSESKQTAVLVKSKRNADALSAYLKTKDIQAPAIHGNLRIQQIEEAGKAFNASEINIIITTDMILKSLELTNIQRIVNYDLPIQQEEYFIRLAYVDEVGEAISFVAPDEEGMLQIIEFKMKLEIPEEEIAGFIPTEISEKDSKSQKNQKKKPRHRKKKQKEESQSTKES